MSLNRILNQYTVNENFSSTFRKDFNRWDIKRVIDTLFLLGIIKDLKDDLEKLRTTRNNIVHGTQLEPTAEEASMCLKTCDKLIPILNP